MQVAIVFSAAGVVAAYLLIAIFFQRRLLYPGARRNMACNEAGCTKIDKIWLQTNSARVEAWLLPATNDSNFALDKASGHFVRARQR